VKRLATSEPGFADAFARLLQRRQQAGRSVFEPVASIIEQVRAGGDTALCALTGRFDRLDLAPGELRVGAAEIDAACAAIPAALQAALELAARRIEAFHALQRPADIDHHDAQGLRLGLRWTALDSVGLYVPGGTAAYPSSVLMNALPARVAGVGRIAMCVPTPEGRTNPLVLAAARLAGVDEIYRIGGAQAIAALAFGTQTVRPVDRIVGPGNAYVAEAKRQVSGVVGIDSVAGPSEVVIIADDSAQPSHVALDLLAQAEHDEMAQSILITTSEPLAAAVPGEVEAALAGLPRAAIAGASWRDHGAIILCASEAEAAELANRLAPEHLQLMLRDPAAVFAAIRHAGAVFIGHDTPEAIGDYVAGPNHVLPTSGAARHASGLSIYDFLKRTTWIQATPSALQAVGPACIALAEAEGLDAHARSVAVRLGRAT